MTRALPTGIARTQSGYRTFVWVPDPARPKGRIASKRWKADATLDEMKRWREEQRLKARAPQPVAAAEPATRTGFPADVLTYFAAIATMPSLKDRKRDMAVWIAEFGDLPRTDITSVMIQTARDRWLTVGPKRVYVKATTETTTRWEDQPIPLAPATVNHRLRALENFFTVMNGKGGANPVRDVDEAEEPEPQPRGQTFALALEILSFMPDRTAPKKGGTHESGSLSRVRFAAMLWTGLPPVQIARLAPEMVDWAAPAFLPPRRKKGRRARRARQRSRRSRQPKPLLPQAVEALRQLFALGANKPFSQSSLERSVRRAIAAANVVRAEKGLPPIPKLTVYELTRHTFGTEVYRSSQNLHVVQELLDHSDPSMSLRYARAALNEHTVLAINDLARRQTRAERLPRSAKAGRARVTSAKTSRTTRAKSKRSRRA
jgi:integrase